MRRNAFGNTGWQVTKVGFGAWAIGSRGYGSVEEKDGFEALAAYMADGGNFIDTARGYGNSENIVGRFLKDENARDDVILCSKVPQTERGAIFEAVEESLRQLQVDAIDLMYLHNPPADPAEMNATLDAFDELKEQGKIKAIGASIKGPSVTGETQELCQQYIDTGRIASIQLIFSILRQGNREVFDYAAANGVGLVGRTCLESGFLTGKYQPGRRFGEGDHRTRWSDETLDAILATAADLQARYVKEPYESLVQVALRFCLDQECLQTIIPGAKNARQAHANDAVAQLPPLPAEVHAELLERFQGRDGAANP